MQGKVDLKEFFNDMQKKQSQISDLVRRKMPVFAGRIAVNHVQDNFRRGGFTNDGVKPWKKSNRELHGGKSANANYKTLHSQRDHLYGSTKYIPGDARVTIINDVHYAGIHNWGGTISPTVTPRMRKFAWAKFYAAGGGKKGQPVGPDANFWKGLALTKKTKLNIKMPQRQFLGYSKEMVEEIQSKLDTELEKVMNS